MRSKLAGLLLAVLLWLPVTLLADGGFIPQTAHQKVQIPDQRALIHFADGRETLVIDTGLEGEGTNFAWLIPVPSAPAIEPATTGLFTTLQHLFQPRIVHNPPTLYRWALVVGFLIAAGVWILRRRQSLLVLLLAMALLGVLSAMLVPALGGTSNPVSEVKVLEQKRVGVYDTATISSTNGDAVFEWLSANGFATPTNFVPTIRAYAAEGWYFVASRLHFDASSPDVVRPHPLALKFSTDRPVYPLRLTGIDNEPCRIELYVFGPERAELPHFEVERCTVPAYPRMAEKTYQWRPSRELRIRHRGLRQVVEGSAVATKLSAVLNSQQMRSDAYIDWVSMEEERLTRYSNRGAAITAANIAVPVLTLGFLVALIRRWLVGIAGPPAGLGLKLGTTIVCASFVIWAAIFIALPRVSVVASVHPGLRSALAHQSLLSELEHYAADVLTNGATPNVTWVREQLAAGSPFRQGVENRIQTNYFTGDPFHEEDSPGNYTIRETAEGIDYVWYDIEGAEYVQPLFRTPRE